MKKYISLLLCFIFIHVQAYALTIGYSRTFAGAECSENTLHQQDDATGSLVEIYVDVQSYCQGFNNDSTERHVKEVWIWHVSNDLDSAETGTLTCRIGTSNNLTTYLTNGEASIVVDENQTDGSWVVLDFSAAMPTISASTAFYAGFRWSESFADKISLGRSTTDVDATTVYYWDVATGSWNMASGPSSVRDFAMRVITCD